MVLVYIWTSYNASGNSLAGYNSQRHIYRLAPLFSKKLVAYLHDLEK